MPKNTPCDHRACDGDPDCAVCKDDPFGCYDWTKGSKAVIASDGEHGVVLQYVGGALDYWLNEAGIIDEFDGFGPGLWIWEGTIVAGRDYWGDGDSELVGELRKLDGDEIMILRDGDDLWKLEDFQRADCPGAVRRES